MVSKIFIGSIGIFFIALSIFSMVQAGTDILDSSVERTMRRWMCGKEIVDPKIIEGVLTQLHKSSQINPISSELFYRQAQLNTTYAAMQPVWDEKSKIFRERAEESYIEALQIRPVWSMALVNLFQNRVLSGEMKNSDFILIDKILLTGKWQSEVQTKLLWLTLGIWESIPEQKRNILGQHFGQVMSVEKIFYSAVAAGSHYGLLEQVAKFNMSNETRERYESLLSDKEKLKSVLDSGANINSFC